MEYPLKKIFIEITNRCNLACSFCQPSSRPKAFMRPTAFKEILQKISGHTRHISLHVLGEALLHPDFESFLTMAQATGLVVNLTTNGILLRRNQTVLLRQPALRQINISLHSFERSDQNAALDAYLDEIFDFIAEAVPASPLLINLRMWNFQATTEEERGLSRLVFRRIEKEFGLVVPISEDFPTGRGGILGPQVFLSREPRFSWPHAPAPDLGNSGRCRGLRDHLAILVDGTVVPCCLDAEGDMSLGNIFQSPLSEIIASPRAVAIREGFARQRVVESLCRRCTYRQRFQHPLKRSL